MVGLLQGPEALSPQLPIKDRLNKELGFVLVHN